MTRPARALIDIPALRHNFQQGRNSAPGHGILAVIKADAYGHGAARVARESVDDEHAQQPASAPSPGESR